MSEGIVSSPPYQGGDREGVRPHAGFFASLRMTESHKGEGLTILSPLPRGRESYVLRTGEGRLVPGSLANSMQQKAEGADSHEPPLFSSQKGIVSSPPGQGGDREGVRPHAGFIASLRMTESHYGESLTILSPLSKGRLGGGRSPCLSPVAISVMITFPSRAHMAYSSRSRVAKSLPLAG